ncbi:hypothetical protein [Hydrocarboniphaga sp.]|uniref:hypothetical protein n=1 Tax=Hydrocarboniphaga sp. TaxID=2033016 RepID=UPI0026180890|nr:hypothetical protein [Hydrocarboniphaga sp.]
MICKACSGQIGLAAVWRPHSRLRAPGSAGTMGFSASPNQKLYACSDCETVLVKGRNTGWSAAIRLA